MQERAGEIAFLGNGLTLLGPKIEVGQKAPGSPPHGGVD